MIYLSESVDNNSPERDEKHREGSQKPQHGRKLCMGEEKPGILSVYLYQNFGWTVSLVPPAAQVLIGDEASGDGISHCLGRDAHTMVCSV